MQLLQEGKQKSSLQLLRSAEKLLSMYRCKELAFLMNLTYNNLACVHKRRGKPVSALKALERGTAVCIEFNEKDNISITHLNICAILSQLGNHRAAAEEARKASFQCKEDFDRASLQLRENVGPTKLSREKQEKTSLLAIAYYNMGVQCEFLNNMKEARDWYQKACQVVEGSAEIDARLKSSFYTALQQASNKYYEMSRRVRLPSARVHKNYSNGQTAAKETSRNPTSRKHKSRLRPMSANPRNIQTLRESRQVHLSAKLSKHATNNRTAASTWDSNPQSSRPAGVYSRSTLELKTVGSFTKRPGSTTPDPASLHANLKSVQVVSSSFRRDALSTAKVATCPDEILQEESCGRWHNKKTSDCLMDEVDLHLMQELGKKDRKPLLLSEEMPRPAHSFREPTKKFCWEPNEERDSQDEHDVLRELGELEWSDSEDLAHDDNDSDAQPDQNHQSSKPTAKTPQPQPKCKKSFSEAMERPDQEPTVILPVPPSPQPHEEEKKPRSVNPEPSDNNETQDAIAALAGGKVLREEDFDKSSLDEADLLESPEKKATSQAVYTQPQTEVSPPVAAKDNETDNQKKEIETAVEEAKPTERQQVAQVESRLDRNSAALIIQKKYKSHVTRYESTLAAKKRATPWKTYFRGMYRSLDCASRHALAVLQYSAEKSRVRIRTVDTETKSQFYFVEREVTRMDVPPLETLRAAWDQTVSKATGSIAQDALDYLGLISKLLNKEAADQLLPRIAMTRNLPLEPVTVIVAEPKREEKSSPARKEPETSKPQENFPGSTDLPAVAAAVVTKPGEDSGKSTTPHADQLVTPSHKGQGPAQMQLVRIDSCNLTWTEEGKKKECQLRLSFWHDSARNITSLRCHDCNTDEAYESAFEILGRDERTLKHMRDFLFVRIKGKKRIVDVRPPDAMKSVVKRLMLTEEEELAIVRAKRETAASFQIQRVYRRWVVKRKYGKEPVQPELERLYQDGIRVGSGYYLMTVYMRALAPRMLIELKSLQRKRVHRFLCDSFDFFAGSTQDFEAWILQIRSSVQPGEEGPHIDLPGTLPEVPEAESEPGAKTMTKADPDPEEKLEAQNSFLSRRAERESAAEDPAESRDEVAKDLSRSSSHMSPAAPNEANLPIRKSITMCMRHSPSERADSIDEKNDETFRINMQDTEENERTPANLQARVNANAKETKRSTFFQQEAAKQEGEGSINNNEGSPAVSPSPNAEKKGLTEELRSLLTNAEPAAAPETVPAAATHIVLRLATRKEDSPSCDIVSTPGSRQLLSEREEEQRKKDTPNPMTTSAIEEASPQPPVVTMIETARKETSTPAPELESAKVDPSAVPADAIESPKEETKIVAQPEEGEFWNERELPEHAKEETKITYSEHNSVILSPALIPPNHTLLYSCTQIINEKPTGMRFILDEIGNISEVELNQEKCATTSLALPSAYATYLSCLNKEKRKRVGLCQLLSRSVFWERKKCQFAWYALETATRFLAAEDRKEKACKIQCFYRRKKAVERLVALRTIKKRDTELLLQLGIRLGGQYQLLRVTLNQDDRNILTIRSTKSVNNLIVPLSTLVRQELWLRIRNDSHEIRKLLKVNLPKILVFQDSTRSIALKPKQKEAPSNMPIRKSKTIVG